MLMLSPSLITAQDVYVFPQAYYCSECTLPFLDIENHPPFTSVVFKLTKLDGYIEVKSEELEIQFVLKILHDSGNGMYKVMSDLGLGFVVLNDQVCWINLNELTADYWEVCFSLYNRFE